MSEENKKSISDKIINFLFSNNPGKWLLLIVILGAVLRFLVARNVSALGDEMVHGPHAIGFLHSGLLSTMAQSPLWFYLTDIVFKILPVTLFSTRFLSFFFGTLSIILVYMISSKIFDKKIGLISAFLIAVSYFTIRYTLAEMDLSAIFFLLSAIYFFIESMERGKFPYLAAVCIGIAALIKTLSLFFIPAFFIGFFLLKKEEARSKTIKKIVIFGLLIALIFSPIIVHNYLWYKDKGMVDVYFAQYFNIGAAREAYAGQAGYDSGVLFPRFFEGVFVAAKLIFISDPLIMIFGILGFALVYQLKEKRKLWIFLLSFEISGFIFLILSNWLPTHYTTLVPLLCIFGAFFVDDLTKRVKLSSPKNMLIIILVVLFLCQMFIPPVGEKTNLYSHLFSKSGLAQLRDYANSNMDKNSIVLTDARIYRGRVAWAFNDFHYLEASYFNDVWQMNINMTGPTYPVKIYFVECASDDCGWGTITQGQLNDSAEELVQLFSAASKPEKVINGGGGYDDGEGPIFRIYSAQIQIHQPIIALVDSTHDWFYYPVNYVPKEKIFDNYQVKEFFSNMLYYFAWIILIFSIIFAIFLPLYIFIKRFFLKTG